MKHSYQVEVSTDRDGWVTVTFPAVPGIHAEAHTREQALQFATTTLSAHLQTLKEGGKPIPEPDVEAIIVDIAD